MKVSTTEAERAARIVASAGGGLPGRGDVDRLPEHDRLGLKKAVATARRRAERISWIRKVLGQGSYAAPEDGVAEQIIGRAVCDRVSDYCD